VRKLSVKWHWQWVSDAWLIVQDTLAATLAWIIAKYLFNHHEPFFAPIAAVVALNATLGERGLNAIKLLLGVLVGILVGELTILFFGEGHGRLAFAIFVAMILARLLGGVRLIMNQAAASAILTVVAVSGAEVGIERLVDAFIGASVALVFSQMLFTPEPLKLLRKAESEVLARMAHGLRLTSDALKTDDEEIANQATNTLRDLWSRLAELGRVRRASVRVTRHSLLWWSRRKPVVQENENAGHLDVLGISCLNLTRTALATSRPDQLRLSDSVSDLADVFDSLASAPAEQAVRQRAVDRVLIIAQRFKPGEAIIDPPLESARVAFRMVATDILLFSGVPTSSEPSASELAGR
jgi:uncharacterized membrane protein YgaE (UPF0421/DUF939 family)